MSKFFKINDARRTIELEEYTFKFQEAYRNGLTGGAWGILEVADEDAASALAEVARQYGAFEIDANEYAVALQKKSSLNINKILHNPTTQESVGRVEAKSDGQTSSAPSAESFDDFMAGPKVEATPEEAQEQEPPQEKVAEASSEKDPIISDSIPSDEPVIPEATTEPAAEESPKETPAEVPTPKKKAAKKRARKS